MNYQRNAEGYADPTAGMAIAKVMREQKRDHHRELMRVCGMVIQRKKVNEMARIMHCPTDHIAELLKEIRQAVERKYGEVNK